MMEPINRCEWVSSNDLLIVYHDKEWGVPMNDDRCLFAFLLLEGAQAGLSWLTILKRREAYRQVFANFNPTKVVSFTEKDYNRLLQNSGIIRNRLKIRSALNNAKKFIEVQKEYGSFASYQWQFVGGKPKQNYWKYIRQIPTVSKEAELFSKDLKKRGFTFVGPIIIYAHMQAVGMVNDHTVDCFRYKEVQELAKNFKLN